MGGHGVPVGRRFQWKIFDGRAVKDARQSIVILRGNGIKLVVMAASASKGQTHKRFAAGVDLLIDNVGAHFNWVLLRKNFGADG